ncbi:hypothetical protein BCV70DRAFT_199186 [Testicularia cyperi]|uniref:Uncharacterized protein n=1 Tax=Testicularia cyperi TaxID=1882483 RepID=A0A317XTU3_9BASI|nr:hypothetical protein BCV70DRAFT_199186 [Testicularia cyperi]
MDASEEAVTAVEHLLPRADPPTSRCQRRILRFSYSLPLVYNGLFTCHSSLWGSILLGAM